MQPVVTLFRLKLNLKLELDGLIQFRGQSIFQPTSTN